MKGWHFMSADCRLGYGDGRLAVVGETLTVDCEPVLCKQGLHASERIIDALTYATGPICSYVEVGGDIKTDTNKFVGTSRTVLWMQDITELLHHFACDVAEQALERTGVAADVRSTQAKELDAAWVAAWDAAWVAARVAARDATMVAARASAWDATRASTRASAWDAAWAEQNAELERRVQKLMETENDD